MSKIPLIEFADGACVPALGLGTWHMGERSRERAREIEAIRLALDLGMTMIDTAEMYGEGGAEEAVGAAIAGRRDEAFLVSKVYPHNASARGTLAACERSLKRLKTDRLDCYLLHWRGEHPLAATVGAFERLRRDGKIARWGVSNFDVSDMDELLALPEGRYCATNQVLYNLDERAIEWRLLDQCRERSITVMAYSPVGQGALLRHRALAMIAKRLDASPAQVALAWVLAQRQVFAIPKAVNPEHIRENRKAADLEFDPATLVELDAAFPPPRRPTRLAVL